MKVELGYPVAEIRRGPAEVDEFPPLPLFGVAHLIDSLFQEDFIAGNVMRIYGEARHGFPCAYGVVHLGQFPRSFVAKVPMPVIHETVDSADEFRSVADIYFTDMRTVGAICTGD